MPGSSTVARGELCPCKTALALGGVNSLGVVLGQEMQRFNRLLHCVTAWLQQLMKALKVHPTTPLTHTSHHTTVLCDTGLQPSGSACTWKNLIVQLVQALSQVLAGQLASQMSRHTCTSTW